MGAVLQLIYAPLRCTFSSVFIHLTLLLLLDVLPAESSHDAASLRILQFSFLETFGQNFTTLNVLQVRWCLCLQ